jgi:ABC-type transporter Mla MlaB component
VVIGQLPSSGLAFLFFWQRSTHKVHVTEETRELLVSLDEKQKELNEHQTNMVNIKMYASDLQTLLAVKQIEKDVETQDMGLQALVNSDSLNQTKLAFVFIVCFRFSCIFSTDTGGNRSATIIWACFSFFLAKVNSQCSSTSTVSFINTKGVELFQIDRDKKGSSTYDTVYIKDNSIAVSSGGEINRCIVIIDIESKVVIDRLPSSGLALLFFWQRSTHKGLIQQLLFQTFECW